MKLTAKLMLVFLLAIMLVTSVNGYLAVRREEQIFQERVADEAQRMAATLEPALRLIWQGEGLDRLAATLHRLSRDNGQVHVRWVWFDAAPGDPYRPAVPAAAAGSLQSRELIMAPGRAADGAAALFAYWHMHLAAPRPGGLEFSYSMAELEASRRQTIVDTLRLLAALVITSGCLVAVAGMLLVGNPLQRLLEKTRRTAKGHLDRPVHLATGDELSELANSLNEMCERLSVSQRRVQEEATARVAALEQLRHADRLRTVGRLASGIAHELGTPLNVISGRAELIAAGQLAPARQAESAQIIKREAERMTVIIRQLLDFARRREPQRARVAIEQIVTQTALLLQPLAAKRDVELVAAPSAETCRAEVDMAQVQQVLTNIVMNAIQASPPGETVRIETSQQVMPAGRQPAGASGSFVCVAVADRGPGIDPGQAKQIFEPFFTTKDVGEGSGLGLSIAERIVAEHGGWIDVDSPPGQGAVFRVYLPCSAPAGSEASASCEQQG